MSTSLTTDPRQVALSREQRRHKGPIASRKPGLPPDRRRLLRVKHLSLMAEAAIIRREASRARYGWEWLALTLHAKGVLRPEARATHLALAFLRDVPYRKVEQSTRPGNEPNWDRVWNLVARYGPTQLSGASSSDAALRAEFVRWQTASPVPQSAAA